MDLPPANPIPPAPTVDADPNAGSSVSGAALNRGPPVAQKAPRELKVEDALLYLDQVKMEFSDKPHIYNEFLDIMKNFKAQSITTPGVIERVKALFKGYNKLILGFNTFLPEGEGYKIELTPEEQAMPHPNDQTHFPTANPPYGMVSMDGHHPGMSHAMPGMMAVHPHALGPAGQSMAAMGVPGVPPVSMQAYNPAPVAAQVPSPGAQPGQMQQAHAIHYVTKIRNRFATEPDTYRSFLKILHTYQREQRGIKEVLEQVSQLFADHPDLLMEFTFFLPDAVQEQAKERLHRAARESEIRKNRRLQEQKARKQQPFLQAATAGGVPPGIPMPSEMMGGPNKRARVNERDAKLPSMSGVPLQPVYGQQPNPYAFPQGAGSTAPTAASGRKQSRRKQAEDGAQGAGPGGKVAYSSSLYGDKHRDTSITAERKFFDQVKDILVGVSRDSWSEFVKALELFSSDIVSKDDMFDMVHDLLVAHPEVFHDFKRLIESKADHVERKEDMWFSVPLSEIDFTQCRKCTPSYRALPKHYPKVRCTERNEDEARVLNDTWVSIPIGSEESYSFKHMRKNQYEEALFKCEDERFEIDMVIDSNMSTIRVLEPLAEEIQNIKKIHGGAGGATGVGCGGGKDATGSQAGAAAGARFNIQLDKRQLSTIHLNAIARIYGDHAEEILELLKRNPAPTVPVILKRLKQKDVEWRKARTELNKHWKEVMHRNHNKSFDHRSFYFKQQDKKYLSTKQLVQEIVSHPTLPAAPDAPSAAATSSAASAREGEVELSAQADDGHHAGIAATLPTFVTPLLGGMTPQMLLHYEHDHHFIHRDIYRIVCHAAESTLTSLNDKERLAALYRDFIRVFFSIPVHYLYPAATPGTAAGPAASHGASPLVAGEAWPVGTKVLTTFGSGTVLGYRAADCMYSVQLPFGLAHLSPSAVLGSEQLPAQALSAVGVQRDPATGEDTIFGGLVASAAGAMIKDPSKVFYGTQMCYIFLRLHHALYTRLRTAKLLAQEMQGKATVPAEEDPVAPGAAAGPAPGPNVCIYTHFLSQVYAVVEGSMDNARFEDFCRTVLGNKSYHIYTLDKIISQLMKHLQAMANDDNVNKLVGLFVYHHSNPKGVDSGVYQQHVAHILAHTMEDVFRIQLMTAGGALTAPSAVAVQHLGILPTASAQQQIATALSPIDATAVSAMDVDVPEAVRRERSISMHGDLVPKAVVSDDESDGDNDEDDDDKSNNQSVEEDLLDRKAVFSPRGRP